MASSILFGLPYHTSEGTFWLHFTIKNIRERFGKDVDILIATDEDVPPVSIPDGTQPIYQVRVPGHGVGKARNAIALYAYYNKYDCVIFMDAHMYIVTDNLLKICSVSMGQPKISLIKNSPEDISSIKLDRSSYTLSSFLDRYTWRWAYINYTATRKTVMTTEPAHSVHRRVIEALVQAQGKLTLPDYWGKEVFDIGISAYRLQGYDITIFPEVEVAHVYKVGSPSWSKRFKVTECKNEPFCGILKGSVYNNGIMWGDAVFALKHYTENEIKRLPVKKDIVELVKRYDKDAMMRIKAFNSYAKYTLDDVYRKLSQYLIGASYYYVR